MVPLSLADIGQSLGGGLLIGAAASLMLLGLGRIAGVSGLTARAVGLSPSGPPRSYAVLFVIGLPLGAMLFGLLANAPAPSIPSSPGLLAVAGLLVRFGTRLGSGCTSGHGVCGTSRLSLRSLVATGTFMAAGMATVAVVDAVGFVW